jgi:hypothetical protein
MAKYSNIGSYQLNKYYLWGQFSFIKKSGENKALTTTIKGAYSQTTSLDIQYFDDYINLDIDDLLVVEGRLFRVDNLDIDHKHQPKDYKIYFATITSIL